MRSMNAAFQSRMGNRGVRSYRRVGPRAETHAPSLPPGHGCGGFIGRWQRWHPRKLQLDGDAEFI